MFFQIGLIIVLFVSWQAVELKTATKIPENKPVADLYILEPEDVPVTKVVPEKPVPVKKTPNIPEVIDDFKEVDDSKDDSNIFAPVEPVSNPVVDVDSVIEVIEKEPIEVPIDKIEEAPIFPGCEILKPMKQEKLV